MNFVMSVLLYRAMRCLVRRSVFSVELCSVQVPMYGIICNTGRLTWYSHMYGAPPIGRISLCPRLESQKVPNPGNFLQGAMGTNFGVTHKSIPYTILSRLLKAGSRGVLP